MKKILLAMLTVVVVGSAWGQKREAIWKEGADGKVQPVRRNSKLSLPTQPKGGFFIDHASYPAGPYVGVTDTAGSYVWEVYGDKRGTTFTLGAYTYEADGAVVTANAITANWQHIRTSNQGSAALDTLDTITAPAGYGYMTLILQIASGQSLFISDSVGNINVGGSGRTLNSPFDKLMLTRDFSGGTWSELFFADNE